MTDTAVKNNRYRWRGPVWAVLAALFCLPLMAMQFTDELNWTLFDFIVAGAALSCMGAVYELVARSAGHKYTRIAGGVMVAGLVLLLVNGAVGLVGDEGSLINIVLSGILFALVIAAFIGLLRVRKR